MTSWLDKLSEPNGVSVHELGAAELSAIQSTMDLAELNYTKVWLPYSRLSSGGTAWFGWVYFVTGIYTIVTKDSDVRLVLTTKQLSPVEFTAATLAGKC